MNGEVSRRGPGNTITRDVPVLAWGTQGRIGPLTNIWLSRHHPMRVEVESGTWVVGSSAKGGGEDVSSSCWIWAPV